MIDFARITAIAGRGGDGAGSFTHIKGKRRGKADGGDGGRGGHIYLEATGDLNTLERFRYVKEYRANNGGNGAPRRRKGAEGKDLVIKVPLGTAVKVDAGPVSRFPPAPSINSGQAVRVYPERSRRAAGSPSTTATRLLIHDLTESSQKILIASGGEGGRGNNHLRDEFGRRPFSGEKGQDGEVVNLTLELKLIADVGLIGFPNAGKSTLLKALTAAKVKIAAYPFTTLEPNLGVLWVGRKVGKWDSRQDKPTDLPTHRPKNLILADIPGLIEGASKGKGLGDLFLRHIERTKILVHLIDISTSKDVWGDYQTIRGELKNYSKELAKKKEIIVLNKNDLAAKSAVDECLSEFKNKRKRVVAISAASGKNLNELIGQIHQAFQ